MENSLKKRTEVDQSLTWDLSVIYKNEEQYALAVKELQECVSNLENKFKGKLNSPESINECLDYLKTVYEIISLTSSYADLQVAVDRTDVPALDRSIRFMNIASDMESRLSFIKSEIIELDDKIIDIAIKESCENSNFLKEIKRNKEHALHPEAERVLSALSGALNSPYSIYNQAKLSDMDFENFIFDGKEYPLSFVLFENVWEYDNNTEIRRAAFDAFSSKLKEYQNTFAAAYQTQVQKEKTLSALRGFNSVFDSLLFNQRVDLELYNRQIDIIMEKLAPHMRRYAKLLQKIHKIDEMTFADLKIAIDPDYEPRISIEESKEYIQKAFSIMGEDYLDIIKKEYDGRGIDFVQNVGKETGAFCATPYKKQSFILLSWADRMSDVFTIAHELGHAGHFYLAHKNQNIFDVEPSSYFVEAPSTMNEILMANYLLETNKDLKFKRWVLSSIISNTYYHNFVTHLLEAAYQREVYRIIDEGGSIQASTLSKIKREVLEKFWGEDVIINDGAELTWMRQPHYYMELYSYTYSAGLTIATEVSRRILKEGQPAVDAWKEVLKAGGTRTPVELAKMAGVDITSEKPLNDTIAYIGSLIDEVIKLTEQIEDMK
ncbi:MAG: oligoendopeptidase [Eubacterium sp.]|nr:oligoendopeptidase [Eubacterium sp.]